MLGTSFDINQAKFVIASDGALHRTVCSKRIVIAVVFFEPAKSDGDLKSHTHVVEFLVKRVLESSSTKKSASLEQISLKLFCVNFCDDVRKRFKRASEQFRLGDASFPRIVYYLCRQLNVCSDPTKGRKACL